MRNPARLRSHTVIAWADEETKFIRYCVELGEFDALDATHVPRIGFDTQTALSRYVTIHPILR